MYGLNVIAFAFFISINLLAYRLCQCSAERREKVLRILCIVLLCGNSIRYFILYPILIGRIHIPIEYSTVAYFAVPIILLCKWESARSWAAYSGLMAGFFYHMAAILLGGPIYGSQPVHSVYISMLCHGSVYFCGLVTIGTHSCAYREGYKLILGTAWVAIRALLLRSLAAEPENTFIYMLLDGKLVQLVCPPDSWGKTMPVYYAAVAMLVLLSMRVFLRISRQKKDRQRIGEEARACPPY